MFRDFESEFRQVLPGFDTQPLFSSSVNSEALPEFDPVLDLPDLEPEEALLEAPLSGKCTLQSVLRIVNRFLVNLDL